MNDVVQSLCEHRATAIFRGDDQRRAALAMDAAVAGGFRIVEFTLTTPGAYELIAEFSRRRDLAPSGGLDHVIVGAGTVLTVRQAERAVAAGARFLVSPIADRDVIEAAASLRVAAMPGVHTPTEMVTAHRIGAPLLKLFPAPAGGPAYLRSIRGPLPFLRIVPTNGVDLDNAAQWLRAGAWAVGFVAALFDPELVQRGDADAIRMRAEALRDAVQSVGSHRPKLGRDPAR